MLDALTSLVRRFNLTDRVVLAKVARAVLVFVAGLGWFTMSEETLATVTSAVAAAGSLLLTQFIAKDKRSE